MSKQELVEAYVRGEVTRRAFIRRLIAAGVSFGAAMAYAQIDPRLAGAQGGESGRITFGGSITAANGDRATLGGNAQSGPLPSGQVEYRDHGPAQPLKAHSVNVKEVTCGSAYGEKFARICGDAIVNSFQPGGYCLELRESLSLNFARMKVTYQEQQYDSGEQQFKGGMWDLRCNQ